MLMAQIRCWSTRSSRNKRNQGTPITEHNALKYYFMSSLLLLPKPKFPLGKKKQTNQRDKASNTSQEGKQDWCILWFGIHHKSCCRVWSITIFSIPIKPHLSQRSSRYSLYRSCWFFFILYKIQHLWTLGFHNDKKPALTATFSQENHSPT